MAPKKSHNEYVYTKLSGINKPCPSVNLYGVILRVDQEFTTLPSGKQHAIISLVDETSPPGFSFRVSFFFTEAISHIKEGTIIRIHRAKVEPWLNTVDGRVFRSTDVVVFPPSERIDDFNFVTTAKSIHYTDEDNRRVSELRRLALTEDDSELFAVSQSGRIHFAFTDKNELNERHDKKDRLQESCQYPDLDQKNGLQEPCQPSVKDLKQKNMTIVDDETCDSDDNGSFRIVPLNENKKKHRVVKKSKKLKEDSWYQNGSFRNPFFSNFGIKNMESTHPTNDKDTEDVEDIIPSFMVDAQNRIITELKSSKDCSSNKTKTSPRQSRGLSVEKNNEHLSASCDDSSSKISQLNGNSNGTSTSSLQPATFSQGRNCVRASHDQHDLSDLSKLNGRDTMETSRQAVKSSLQKNNEYVNAFNHDCSHDKLSQIDCTIKTVPSLIPSLKRPPDESADFNSAHASKLEKVCNTDSKYAANTAQERSEKLITSEDDRLCAPESPRDCSVWLKKLETPTNRNKKSRKGDVTTVFTALLKKGEVSSSDGQGKVNCSKKMEGNGEEIGKPQESAKISSTALPSSNGAEQNVISPCKHVQQYNFHLSSSPSSSDSNSTKNVGDDDIHSCSTLSVTESSASNECPGLVCVRAGCDSSAPVILSDDDPRLNNYDEILLEEIEMKNVDISCDPDVQWSRLETYLPYSDNIQVYRVGLKHLQEFKWPVHQTKVQVLNVKPPLKVLQSYGPKNLLSGCCSYCALHFPYSRLRWDKDIASGKKRPLCPNCFEDGKTQYVSLSFRLKLFLKDAWGTKLPVLATKTNATSFLGVSDQDYLLNAKSRERVIKNLSRIIRSQSFYKVQIQRVVTQAEIQYHLYNTSLKNLLNFAD